MKKIKFKENLKNLRIALGLSQAQLAEKLNVNQRTVSAWEKGICEPSLTTLTQISEFFDESLDSLLY